jgi:predicted GNAT family acetyltransferase
MREVVLSKDSAKAYIYISQVIMETYTIHDNAAGNRFEMPVEGGTAYITYRVFDGVLTLFYIFVPPESRGRKLSAKLIDYALAYAEEQGLTLDVRCPYMAGYIERIQK